MWFLIILWKLRVSLKNARGVDLSYLKENLSIVLVATNSCIERRFRNIVYTSRHIIYILIHWQSVDVSRNDLKKIWVPNCRCFSANLLGKESLRTAEAEEQSRVAADRDRHLWYFFTSQGTWGPSFWEVFESNNPHMEIVYVCYSIFFLIQMSYLNDWCKN